VETVRHQHPVQVCQAKRFPKVGYALIDLAVEAGAGKSPALAFQGSRILVDRRDVSTRPQQFGQREGEVTVP